MPGKQPSETPFVWVRVVGGPAGQPYLIANSATKRGFSVKQVRWRLPKPLKKVERVGGAYYRLVENDGKPYYLHVRDPVEAVTDLRRLFR